MTICDTLRSSLEHILHFSLLLLLVSLVIAIVIFYGLIVRTIFKSRHLPNNKENSNSTVRKGNLKGARFRAIIFMVVTIVSYIGLVPTGVFAIIAAFKAKDTDTDNAAYFDSKELITRLPFLNNIVNPIIYIFMDKSFRKEIKELYMGVYQMCNKSMKL